MGKEANLKGLIDIVSERAMYFDGQYGETLRYEDIPAEFREQVRLNQTTVIFASYLGLPQSFSSRV